ncbi:hypothetical protein DFH08DRAFT_1021475 [Mycena albidolilacea]|uniref:Uncharacterized protein n=1 Tax=Mycena albidolilacea TaxID=1033008 RepID=A0AAD6ZNZ4_9AGAR|nr:hypothetical protein DFH08DRAFT_1021475 [Mycena albidolilacea]
MALLMARQIFLQSAEPYPYRARVPLSVPYTRWSYVVDTWIDFNSIPIRWACFPRRNMRRDLLSARQRNDEKVRNFIRRVIRPSKRLGDVSDCQIVQIVWDGALGYLRLKWAGAGFDFETSSLSALEIAAK